MHSLWLSWKHLVHKPASLILNLTLLALSTGLIAAVLLFNRMLTDRLDKNLAGIDMVIGAKGSPLQLILAGMYHIDVPTGNIPLSEANAFLRPDHPLVGLAVPLSLGDSYKGYRIVGTDQRFLELYNLSVADGMTFYKPFEVLAGAQVAHTLGLKLGDIFFSVHGLDDNEDLTHDDTEPFRIAGILEPSGTVADQLLLVSNETVWMVHDHDHDHHHHDHDDHELEDDHVHGPDCDHDHAEEGHVHGPECDHDHDHDHAHQDHIDEEDRSITTVLVKFKLRNHLTLNMPRTINENTSMQAASPALELNRLYSMLGSAASLLKGLAWIILAVSGMSIFVSLYNSMQARRYELALMRVMGSSPLDLFRLIVQEGFLLALLGGLIGLFLAHLGIYVAGNYLQAEWKYTFNPFFFLQEEFYLLGGMLLFGVIAAYLPARQAKYMDIAKTLSQG
jgi:putative ABC transport system permease protein